MIPPVSEGTIKLISCSNILKNKLILRVDWFTKDHTDSEHNSETFDIKENQWEEIIQKELVGKKVEFDVLDEENKLVKITFPPIPYTEQETRNLVFKTWDKIKPFHYNQAGSIEEFNTWWDSIKKLK